MDIERNRYLDKPDFVNRSNLYPEQCRQKRGLCNADLNRLRKWGLFKRHFYKDSYNYTQDRSRNRERLDPNGNMLRARRAVLFEYCAVRGKWHLPLSMEFQA